MFEIIEKVMLNPTICKMVVKAPRVAKSAKPGQFLIVRTDEAGERIPLTISDYDPKAGTVTIVIQPIGASTLSMVEDFNAGDSFADVVGPLGNPSEFVTMPEEELKKQKVVFIAGGLGTAPVYPQAKWLHERGVAVDVIIGARTKDLLIYEDEFKSVCDNLYMCTDDGSYGFKGVGTARLEALVAEGKTYTKAVAIGPMIMMKFSTLTCVKLGIPIIVSMNTLMVDGTGMCGACRLSVGGVTKFACVDGPEFDGALVDFNEAMRRSAQYKPEEAAAKEQRMCRAEAKARAEGRI
ncbi:MAG: sulfide/dihydroorotate dehydrogenase-like FAD/NAD-binding protein [Bacteroidales bacterium]|nr:sulfide/dihydroorotate dehydrogenase-like FAD/NAD-binding protein [Bacteroidales bacterium]